MSPRHFADTSRHILVIEDNDDGRESLRLLLSLLGHYVEVAADGKEGLRKALETHPEVAIVDINMPGMNGYQVAQRLRQVMGKGITLIAHTAYPEDPTDRRTERNAFDAWVVKPGELAELMSSLEARDERDG